MTVTQLCHGRMARSILKRYGNALIGILIVPMIQFVVAPIQMVFDSNRINIPASILIMGLLTTSMLIMSFINTNIVTFYANYLKGPADFLGRHMSLGFVASVLMLSRDHIANYIDILRIAGAFLVTTLLSYIGAYSFAAISYSLEQRARNIQERCKDTENKAQNPRSSPWLPMNTLPTTKIVEIKFNNELVTSEKTPCAPFITLDFVVQTFPIWTALFILITVGVPVYCAANHDMPFEVVCFSLLWIAAIHFQRSIESCKLLKIRPKFKTFMVILLNPVLMTSALCTIYFWTKAMLMHCDIEGVLGKFQRHNSWAEIIVSVRAGGSFKENVGAGDLANALLDAGIVSLGLKMFEYRRELWNSFTTIFSTCLVFATINVFINVIFARAVGLESADALAFCARNATIALGVPAVQKLNGSTSLMSALATFSGMLFQMTGDLLISLLRINDEMPTAHASFMSNENETEEETTKSFEYRVIAAGVTVGINAAAMGTSHLIERNSRCTAYSALSMTLFGIFTVALTAIPAVADALKMLAMR